MTETTQMKTLQAEAMKKINSQMLEGLKTNSDAPTLVKLIDDMADALRLSGYSNEEVAAVTDLKNDRDVQEAFEQFQSSLAGDPSALEALFAKQISSPTAEGSKKSVSEILNGVNFPSINDHKAWSDYISGAGTTLGGFLVGIPDSASSLTSGLEQLSHRNLFEQVESLENQLVGLDKKLAKQTLLEKLHNSGRDRSSHFESIVQNARQRNPDLSGPKIETRREILDSAVSVEGELQRAKASLDGRNRAHIVLGKIGTGVKLAGGGFSVAQGGVDIAAGVNTAQELREQLNNGTIKPDEFTQRLHRANLRTADGAFGMAGGITAVAGVITDKLSDAGKIGKKAARFAPIVGGIIAVGSGVLGVTKNALAADDARKQGNHGRAAMFGVMATVDAVNIVLDTASTILDMTGVGVVVSVVLDVISIILDGISSLIGFFTELVDTRSDEQKLSDAWDKYLDSDGLKNYLDSMSESLKNDGYDIFKYAVDAETAGITESNKEERLKKKEEFIRDLQQNFNNNTQGLRQALTEAVEDHNSPLRKAIFDNTGSSASHQGGSAADLIRVLVKHDGIKTLFGNGGDDTLIGSQGVEHIFGGEGNDLINGGGGADKLVGGPGNDIFITDGKDVLVDGGAGKDLLGFHINGLLDNFRNNSGKHDIYTTNNGREWSIMGGGVQHDLLERTQIIDVKNNSIDIDNYEKILKSGGSEGRKVEDKHASSTTPMKSIEGFFIEPRAHSQIVFDGSERGEFVKLGEYVYSGVYANGHFSDKYTGIPDDVTRHLSSVSTNGGSDVISLHTNTSGIKFNSWGGIDTTNDAGAIFIDGGEGNDLLELNEGQLSRISIEDYSNSSYRNKEFSANIRGIEAIKLNTSQNSSQDIVFNASGYNSNKLFVNADLLHLGSRKFSFIGGKGDNTIKLSRLKSLSSSNIELNGGLGKNTLDLSALTSGYTTFMGLEGSVKDKSGNKIQFKNIHSLKSSAGSDTIIGSDKSDQVFALGGSDTVSTGKGNDILIAHTSENHQLNGGEGQDTYILKTGVETDASDGITITENSLGNILMFEGISGLEQLRFVENSEGLVVKNTSGKTLLTDKEWAAQQNAGIRNIDSLAQGFVQRFARFVFSYQENVADASYTNKSFSAFDVLRKMYIDMPGRSVIAEATNTNITTGNGSDTVIVGEKVRGGAVVINTEEANDIVSILDSFEGTATINTGEGRDMVSIHTDGKNKTVIIEDDIEWLKLGDVNESDVSVSKVSYMVNGVPKQETQLSINGSTVVLRGAIKRVMFKGDTQLSDTALNTFLKSVSPTVSDSVPKLASAMAMFSAGNGGVGPDSQMPLAKAGEGHVLAVAI